MYIQDQPELHGPELDPNPLFPHPQQEDLPVVPGDLRHEPEPFVFPEIDVDEPEEEDEGQQAEPELEPNYRAPKPDRQALVWTAEFIEQVKAARIENLPISEEDRIRLTNPAETEAVIDQDVEHALGLLIDLRNSPDEAYEKVRQRTLARYHPDHHEKTIIPSKYLAWQKVAELTGVTALMDDMCRDSCTAFTGPFEKLDKCPYCFKARYTDTVHPDGTRDAFLQATTIPIGPILQGIYRSPDRSKRAAYRREATARIQQLADEGGEISELKDYVDGLLYQGLIDEDTIKPEDVVILFSMDGAQLLKLKASDCWIYIWIVLEFSPEERFKKNIGVYPGGFIPGPNNPKNYDSFLFRGLHYLNALMNDGLGIWDASRRLSYTSHPYLMFTTLDGVALARIHGVNGHLGAVGCRIMCPQKARRRKKGKRYYPACRRANGERVDGSDHPDINPAHVEAPSSAVYDAGLRKVLAVRSDAEFKRVRMQTGISKQTIFSGLRRMPAFPQCLTIDCMHLCGPNLQDLLVPLLRGDSEMCVAPDKTADWPWAVFSDQELWELTGADVAEKRSALSTSHGRPPRDPALKLHSGYRTWEVIMWLWIIAPGLWHDILPEAYFRNFCLLASNVRRIFDRSHMFADVQKLNLNIIEFHNQFEDLYYDRKQERIHFMRQSLHTLLHVTHEIVRVGPLGLVAQWTIERTIGDLKRQLRNPSEIYAEYAIKGLRQAQLNTLYSLFPQLDPSVPSPADNTLTQVLGDGYVLRHPRLTRGKWMAPSPEEIQSIKQFVEHNYAEDPRDIVAPETVAPWGRLQLPNSQIARSLWREHKLRTETLRCSRNVKVTFNLLIALYPLADGSNTSIITPQTMLQCRGVSARYSITFASDTRWRLYALVQLLQCGPIPMSHI
jgi:hypothetical protein